VEVKGKWHKILATMNSHSHPSLQSREGQGVSSWEKQREAGGEFMGEAERACPL